MFKLSKSVLSFGAGALAVVALMLAAPRAAHAVAAALVQVTNTASNPAVTQDVSHQVSQLVSLGDTTIGGQPSQFLSFLSNGTYVNGYTVPANQYLVINSADVSGQQGCAGLNISLGMGNYVFASWIVSGPDSVHFGYPSGIVVPPGATPLLIVNGPGTCSGSLQLHGYLTSN
jgi:hypothetical protein